MMKKSKVFLIFLTFTLLLFAYACGEQKTENNPKMMAKKATSTAHPEEMGNQDCLDCHKDITPDAVKQWENSAHAFTGVKCQVCHGDEKNFQASPANETCRGCHSQQYDHNIVSDKTCSSCHVAHNFTIHKVRDYK